MKREFILNTNKDVYLVSYNPEADSNSSRVVTVARVVGDENSKLSRDEEGLYITESFGTFTQKGNHISPFIAMVARDWTEAKENEPEAE